MARIGYAVRHARRDRFLRLPLRLDGQICASGSPWLESKQPAEVLEGVAPVVSSPIGTLSHAEAPAPPQRFNFPGAGGVGGSSARPTAARGVTAPGCSGALRPIDGRKGDGDMISY